MINKLKTPIFVHPSILFGPAGVIHNIIDMEANISIFQDNAKNSNVVLTSESNEIEINKGLIIQEQKWNGFIRYIVLDKYGSIIMDLFDEPQQWWRNSTNTGTAWFWSLFVLPEFRMQGHAKRLIAEAERMIFEKGHKSVYACVEERLTPHEILDFYIRQKYFVVEKSKEGVMIKKYLNSLSL